MTRIITAIAYQFDELSVDAQEKAIELIAEKLNGEWWDSSDNDDVAQAMAWKLAEQFEASDENGETPDAVPSVELAKWELSGGYDHLYLRGTLTPALHPALPWADGMESVELDYSWVGGQQYDVVWSDPYLDATAGDPDPSGELEAAMQGAVDAAVAAALRAGQAELEYKTSAEYARDAIDANGWEFSEDGTTLI